MSRLVTFIALEWVILFYVSNIRYSRLDVNSTRARFRFSRKQRQGAPVGATQPPLSV